MRFVTLSVTLAPGVTLPAGSTANVPGVLTSRWALSQSVTNSASTPQTLSVPATCTVPGPITAGIGTITNIATPVNGWTAVTNDGAATPGANVETDSALLVRRVTDLTPPRETTLPSILSACQQAALGTTLLLASVIVEENVSDYVGGPTRPNPIPSNWPTGVPIPTEQESARNIGRAPHSVECLLRFSSGFTDSELVLAHAIFARLLFAQVGGGIATYSGTGNSGIAVDTAANAFYALAELSCTLTAGTTLPTNSVAQDSLGQFWATTVAATNSGGTSATLTVPAVCLSPNPQPVLPNTITVPGAPGWTAVTNPAASVRERGALYTMFWSEVQQTPVYVTVTLLVDDTFAGNSAAVIAIQNYFGSLEIGDPVLANQIIAACMRVTGVVDVTATAIGTSSSPTSTADITIGPRNIASLAAGQPVINSSGA